MMWAFAAYMFIGFCTAFYHMDRTLERYDECDAADKAYAAAAGIMWPAFWIAQLWRVHT